MAEAGVDAGHRRGGRPQLGQSIKSTGDAILGLRLAQVGEDSLGLPELDQFTQIHG